LDEELRGLLEMAAEEKMKEALSRKEAFRAVRLERGNLEATRRSSAVLSSGASSATAILVSKSKVTTSLRSSI
jgi:hypothetical protein